MKKVITIYPYYKGFYDYIRHLSLCWDSCEIGYVVSLKGLKLDKKDIGYIENRKSVGLLVNNNLEEALEKSDILFILPINRNISYREKIIENILMAIKRKKHVICMMFLYPNEIEMFVREAQCNNVEIDYIFSKENSKEETKQRTEVYRATSLDTPDVPIVFIGETLPIGRWLGILLDVRNYLQRSGYKVLTISETTFSKFLEMHEYPDCFFSNNMSDYDKILYLNKYILDLCVIENPDVIFMQVPDVMMKYNNMFTNGFGVYAYILSHIVSPDFFILVDCYNETTTNYYEMISSTFIKRFGFPIDVVCMTNCFFDYQRSKTKGGISLRYINYQKVSDKILKLKNSSIPIFDESDNKIGLKIAEELFQKLT